MVNVHFSLLPRWRGAAPVERAIMAGDDHTGVCVMAVEEGLDTGAVYARADLPIRRTTTADALAQQLAGIGAALLTRTLKEGLVEPQPQVGEPVYAHKLGPEDLALRWERPADELDRIVRVGGAWTTRTGHRLKVHRARPWPREQGPGPVGSLHGSRVTTGAGTLELLEVQPEGKGRLPFTAWANGAHPVDGEVLGVEEDDR
jgi:methionyl-tRNA formyltransferase